MVERFISADCEICWKTRPVAATPSDAWSLDWIVPGSRGDEAPLAPAAPAEAQERAVRLGLKVVDQEPVARRTALVDRAGRRLAVASGPAWHGYLGVQLELTGRWPAGATAWLALVESVPAGTDESPVPRRLVRAVAGPVAIDQTAGVRRETRAMRWPETAKAERLLATAWVEAGDGRIVGFARERCTPAER